VIIIGIDPGLSGALAVLHQDLSVTIYDTPTLTVAGAKGSRREYDLAMMSSVVRSLGLVGQTVAYIESVHAMPGQGVRSMFTMGDGFGSWKGILAALSIPYTLVTPQRWKKYLMDGMGKDKDASRLRAIQLFPTYADLFSRKKDDGRAEALLIAWYGRQHRSQ
jgi:crossover junction endodeoxyribonuclease RuvC